MKPLTNKQLRRALYLLALEKRRGGGLGSSEVGELLDMVPKLLAEVVASRRAAAGVATVAPVQPRRLAPPARRRLPAPAAGQLPMFDSEGL